MDLNKPFTQPVIKNMVISPKLTTQVIQLGNGNIPVDNV